MGASSELERADETISLKHVHKYMPWEPPARSKEPTKHYPYSMYASTCHGTAPSEPERADEPVATFAHNTRGYALSHSRENYTSVVAGLRVVTLARNNFHKSDFEFLPHKRYTSYTHTYT